MPRFEDQESMDDEEMELVLNAIEYIKGLYLKHFQQSWADTAMTSDTYSNTIVLRSPWCRNDPYEEPYLWKFSINKTKWINSLLSFELSIGMPLGHIQLLSSEPSTTF